MPTPPPPPGSPRLVFCCLFCIRMNFYRDMSSFRSGSILFCGFEKQKIMTIWMFQLLQVVCSLVLLVHMLLDTYWGLVSVYGWLFDFSFCTEEFFHWCEGLCLLGLKNAFTMKCPLWGACTKRLTTKQTKQKTKTHLKKKKKVLFKCLCVCVFWVKIWYMYVCRLLLVLVLLVYQKKKKKEKKKENAENIFFFNYSAVIWQKTAIKKAYKEHRYCLLPCNQGSIATWPCGIIELAPKCAL